MSSYPVIVNWSDGTATRFDSQREHDAAIVRCEVLGGHAAVSLRLGVMIVERACWRCLTVEVKA